MQFNAQLLLALPSRRIAGMVNDTGVTPRNERPFQFGLRTALIVQLAFALFMALGMWLGFAVPFVIAVSSGSVWLRRYFIREAARVHNQPCPLQPPLIPRPIEADEGSASSGRSLARWLPYLRQPLDIALVWGIWTGWALGWWAWCADMSSEKDFCCRLAVLPLCAFCLCIIARHHYSLARESELRMRAARYAAHRTFFECIFLGGCMDILAFFMHFP